MKISDRLRILIGKQPKIKKSQRWRYMKDGITKYEV